MSRPHVTVVNLRKYRPNYYGLLLSKPTFHLEFAGDMHDTSFDPEYWGDDYLKLCEMVGAWG